MSTSQDLKNPRKGASIQLAQELAKPLQEFGKKARMSGSDVARTIIAFSLPRLINGEFEIVNGEIRQVVPRDERHRATRAA